MKLPASSQYILKLLAGENQWIIGHLYTFTSAAGATDYFTDLDVDIAHEGHNYKSTSIRIQGIRMKLGVGVSVDEQEVVIWAGTSDTLFGGEFLGAMGSGVMDGGTIARDRIVWENKTGDVLQDIQETPAAVWRMFLGYMSSIEKLGRASCTFKLKSPLVKLSIQMPRNFYQPSCLWSLFDSGCTLNRDNFAVSGTISTADIRNIGMSGGIPNPGGADGLPNYQRGRIKFTSGVNNGLIATIDSNDGSFFYLAYLLVEAPSPGDSFIVYPGCMKTFNTCQLKFNNTNNFRGFDKVPPVFVSA